MLLIAYLFELKYPGQVISYEQLKTFFNQSGIKSNVPLPIMLSDVSKVGYIEKNRYKSQKEIATTSKGEKHLGEVLEKLLK